MKNTIVIDCEYSAAPGLEWRTTLEFRPLTRGYSIWSKRVAHLCKVVRDNSLSYVAWALSTADHAWSVRYIHSPNGYGSAISELCVSGQEIWIRSKINTLWGTDEFVTERFPLRAIALVDLLKQTDVKLPALIQRSTLKEYEKRLRAVHDAEHVNEPISESMCRLEAAVPDEYLALTDRLLGKRQECFCLQVENDTPQATHS